MYNKMFQFIRKNISIDFIIIHTEKISFSSDNFSSVKFHKTNCPAKQPPITTFGKVELNLCKGISSKYSKNT